MRNVLDSICRFASEVLKNSLRLLTLIFKAGLFGFNIRCIIFQTSLLRFDDITCSFLTGYVFFKILFSLLRFQAIFYKCVHCI